MSFVCKVANTEPCHKYEPSKDVLETVNGYAKKLSRTGNNHKKFSYKERFLSRFIFAKLRNYTTCTNWSY